MNAESRASNRSPGIDDSGDGTARGSLLPALILAAGLAGCATGGVPPGGFQFGVVGDVPYTRQQEQDFPHVLAAMNASDLAFVVHVGDFQADPREHYRQPQTTPLPCTDEKLKATLALLESSRHPIVLTPGDNDWTDCHFVKERRIDPLDELGKVRTAFYPPGRSLGQRTMPVASQSQDPRYAQFRENLRWTHGGVTFATLHMVGSNDNFGRTPEMNAEHAERAAANLAWMREAFALARRDGSLGVVLLTQANPGFESHWTPELLGRYFRNFAGAKPPIPPRPSAYDGFIGALAEEVARYTRPVAFIHGDTHLFRIDQPLLDPVTQRTFTHFTRMETFGNPDTRWTRVIVDPSDPALFTFRAESGKQ